jgi:methylated-DNA-[protein]-cysteine S-methyltransferase
MRETYYDYADSPLGRILLVADDRGLVRISFQAGSAAIRPDPGWRRRDEPLAEARRQLRAYFAGELRAFDLPLAPRGTPFQQAVWRAVRAIPYGATASYADVARRIGRPAATRAVGAANGANPLPIVIPCHRVVGARGRLTGYAGGIHLKDALLARERTPAAPRPAPAVNRRRRGTGTPAG